MRNELPRRLFWTIYFSTLVIVLLFAVAIRQGYETRHPQPTGAPAGVAAEPYGGAIYWVTPQK